MSDLVRLHTRQCDKTLEMLDHEGHIINKRLYVRLHFGDMAQHCLNCCDWFAEQAARLVSKPASHSFYGNIRESHREKIAKIAHPDETI
mgnify:CR=1 FL=1